MDSGGGGAGAIVGTIIGLFFVGLILASCWKIFTKAGKPGWAIFVPIYNLVVLLQIVEKPTWWIVLFLIPGVNTIMAFVMHIVLGKAFDRSGGFIAGMIFLPFIFYPALAFGEARYRVLPAGA